MPVDPHNKGDRRTHKNGVLSELRVMEKVAFALVNGSDSKPSDVAQLMRAYVACEQQRNILRMRPAPKPVDTLELRKRKRSAHDGPISPDLPARKPRKQAPSDPGSAQ